MVCVGCRCLLFVVCCVLVVVCELLFVNCCLWRVACCVVFGSCCLVWVMCGCSLLCVVVCWRLFVDYVVRWLLCVV